MSPGRGGVPGRCRWLKRFKTRGGHRGSSRTDHAFALEALNHYTTLDGRAVTLRAVALTDRGPDGLATSARLYTDTAPLFAAG